MKITLTNDWNHATIESDSGNIYHVDFAGRGDCDEVSTWTCDCPAGRHGRTCKHIKQTGLAVGWLEDGNEAVDFRLDGKRVGLIELTY
jgi:uncharacterized Zn finger protein